MPVGETRGFLGKGMVAAMSLTPARMRGNCLETRLNGPNA